MSTSNVPSARYLHTAVWTGSEMIVWGGTSGSSSLNNGGRYNPTTDTWTATTTTNAPVPRTSHKAIWTESEMIVWGGISGSSSLNSGGRYNPTTDTWTATTTTNAPIGRFAHTAVWTGSEMIVWGGTSGSSSLNSGGRYNPTTDTWTPVSAANAPVGRYDHTAVWTGSEMIVWSGFDSLASPDANSGGRYNPVTNSWTTTSTANAPHGRFYHTAVWTGSEMIVWGGVLVYGDGSPSNTGGSYRPSTDSWTVMSTANAPSGRYVHTAVWTSNEMIVWGGANGLFNSGGRYGPGSDSWVSTDTATAPIGRYDHTAVWTGSEMIVWGGYGDSALNTGGRYCSQPPTTLSISGSVLYCSNPVPGPVTNTTLTLTGGAGGSTLSDGSGNYSLTGIAPNGNYTVTPAKSTMPPGSSGINTVDVIATQRHYLLVSILTGCRLTAADVNADTNVTTVDVIAIQRFYLGLTTGMANTGKYQFSPASRSYSSLTSDQSNQNYDALVFGDVASPFVE